MAKGSWIGIDSKARKIKNLWIGIDNKARKIKKMWIGIADKARLIFSGGDIAYETTISSPLITHGNYITGGALGDNAIFAVGAYSAPKLFYLTPSLTCTSIATSVGGTSMLGLIGELTNYVAYKFYNSAWAGYVNTSLTCTSSTSVVNYGSMSSQVHDRSKAFWGMGSVSNSIYPLMVNNSLTHTTLNSTLTSYSGTGPSSAGNGAGVGFACGYVLNLIDSAGTKLTSMNVDIKQYARGAGTEKYMFFAGGGNDSTVYNTIVTVDKSFTAKVASTTLSVARAHFAAGANDEQAIFAGGALNGNLSGSSNVGYANLSATVDKIDASLTRTTLPSLSKSGYHEGNDAKTPCVGGKIYVSCTYGDSDEYLYVYSA